MDIFLCNFTTFLFKISKSVSLFPGLNYILNPSFSVWTERFEPPFMYFDHANSHTFSCFRCRGAISSHISGCLL